ncbi:hypothetical protein Ciccas_007587 [Cichlidogyrus casuarinus]|uniref:Uncharacterized protein n=1 Tax=Cichlidogyrus casuarinus TaxID=1844966 RepID=A0ABD2Q2T4_9PLAT
MFSPEEELLLKNTVLKFISVLPENVETQIKILYVIEPMIEELCGVRLEGEYPKLDPVNATQAEIAPIFQPPYSILSDYLRRSGETNEGHTIRVTKMMSTHTSGKAEQVTMPAYQPGREERMGDKEFDD